MRGIRMELKEPIKLKDKSPKPGPRWPSSFSTGTAGGIQ